jgi:type IV pilus assembly protein PilB
MGLEPFLVVASVNTIVAQRLIRKICNFCKVEQSILPDRLEKVGLSKEIAASTKCYRGKGCDKCSNSGYKGRVAIYEVLDLSQTLKEMVLRGESIVEIKKQALNEGLKTLRMSALSKVQEGLTTLEEALSLTMEN